MFTWSEWWHAGPLPATSNHLLPERDPAWPQVLAEIDAFLNAHPAPPAH